MSQSYENSIFKELRLCWTSKCGFCDSWIRCSAKFCLLSTRSHWNRPRLFLCHSHLFKILKIVVSLYGRVGYQISGIWGHKGTFCTYSLICCPTCSKSPQNGSHPFLCHSQLFIILNNCIIHYGNVIYQISGIFGHWAILCASFLSNLYQKPHKSTKFIFISLMICWFYAHLTPEAIKTTSPSAHSFVTFDQ